MGQTRTSPGDLGMSASPSKVDIGQGEWDGRFVPIPEVAPFEYFVGDRQQIRLYR